jgi:hypothetical protein
MSSQNVRFSSYYQKLYGNFDNGLNHWGISIANLIKYKNYSASFDTESEGNDVLKDIRVNMSAGKTFKQKYTFAVSGGMFIRSLDKNKLIFNESEEIAYSQSSKFVLSLSGFAHLLNKKINLAIALNNINQPTISFLRKAEIIHMNIESKINWQMNDMFAWGIFYQHEDKQNYIGIKTSVDFPYPHLKHELFISKEKISYQPCFTISNQWKIKLEYQLYQNFEDLGYENYGVGIVYEWLK